jgi:hypothetical protein
MSSDIIPDDLIKLWATPEGRHCTLTRLACGLPFVVTIWHGPVSLKSLTFADHDSAAVCTIAEMNPALGALQSAPPTPGAASSQPSA